MHFRQDARHEQVVKHRFFARKLLLPSSFRQSGQRTISHLHFRWSRINLFGPVKQYFISLLGKQRMHDSFDDGVTDAVTMPQRGNFI